MKLIHKLGVTSVILRVFLPDTASATGAGKVGLDYTSAGLIISTIASNDAAATTYTSAGSTIETITTLGTYAAPTANKCRFKAVDATNFPGVYEIQIADARFAVAGARHILVSVQATGAAPTFAEVQLVSVDLYDAVRLGLTALPNAGSSDPGGLATLIAGVGASANAATTAAGDAATAAGAAQTAAEAAQVAAEAADGKLTAERLGVLDALDITIPDTGIPTLAFFTNAPGGTADAPTVPHQGPYNLTLEDPGVRVIELAVDSAVTLRFVLRNAFGQPMDLTAATGGITATLTDRNNAAVDDPIVCGERFLPDGIITVRLDGVYTATADRFHLSVRADFGSQVLTWADFTVVFS